MNKKSVKKPMGKKEMKKTKGGSSVSGLVFSNRKKHNPEPVLGPCQMGWLPGRSSTTQMEK